MFMKLRTASLCLLTICIFALPAIAQSDLYDNGPINGTINAFTINFGFAVSDTFTLASASTVTGLSFGAWVEPGDILQSAEVSITSNEFGGTSVLRPEGQLHAERLRGQPVRPQRLHRDQQRLLRSQPECWNVLVDSPEAASTLGHPVYWDDNNGPSSASINTIGTLPSESFTVLGTGSTTSSTPEPTSILLFGSGVIGVGALLRRKLF